MIEMYKILSGKYDTAVIPRVNREYSSITRGNDLRLQTRRPTSADRTARRQFQATGQPVSGTQASDAMTSRLPRHEVGMYRISGSGSGQNIAFCRIVQPDNVLI